MLGVGQGASNNAESAVIVTVCERNALSDVRMADHFLRVRQTDVAGGGIDVVDVGQDQLQRTAFGAKHQVNVLNVALERVTQLLFGQHQKAHHAHTESQKNQAQSGLELLRSQILPGDVEPIHDVGIAKDFNSTFRS